MVYNSFSEFSGSWPLRLVVWSVWSFALSATDLFTMYDSILPVTNPMGVLREAVLSPGVGGGANRPSLLACELSQPLLG